MHSSPEIPVSLKKVKSHTSQLSPLRSHVNKCGIKLRQSFSYFLRSSFLSPSSSRSVGISLRNSMVYLGISTYGLLLFGTRLLLDNKKVTKVYVIRFLPGTSFCQIPASEIISVLYSFVLQNYYGM